jgi:hypothetical protein
MHGMARSRKIRTATTDTIPGLDYAVDRRMMTWGSGKSVGDAVEEMKDWAAEHDYDAIVGIQLESVADISSNIAGMVESAIYWVAYGTAIAFRPPHSQPPPEPGANADNSQV